MKKYLVFILLILISCEKDLIEPLTDPTQEMIFEMGEVAIKDGQNISFEVITNTPHQLIITQQDGSVITKETFTPTLGINTRKIYTKSLSPNLYNLILIDNNSKVGKVKIIVD